MTKPLLLVDLENVHKVDLSRLDKNQLPSATAA